MNMNSSGRVAQKILSIVESSDLQDAPNVAAIFSCSSEWALITGSWPQLCFVSSSLQKKNLICNGFKAAVNGFSSHTLGCLTQGLDDMLLCQVNGKPPKKTLICSKTCPTGTLRIRCCCVHTAVKLSLEQEASDDITTHCYLLNDE